MSDNNSKPLLVSIITVVYNGQEYIETAIKSVLSQSYPHIEYIIIDGGSTDNTLNVINKYKNAIAKIVSEKDRGIADAFNKGISLASGDIIGLLNSDDWYEQNAIQNIVDNYSSLDEIICGNIKLYNSNNIYKIKKSSIKGIKHLMTLWHPAMFCSKYLYNTLGTYNINYKILMDYDFVLRAYLANVKFNVIDFEITNMRYGGVSNKLIKKSMQEGLIIKNKHMGVKFIHKIEYLYYSVYFNVVIFIKNIIYK